MSKSLPNGEPEDWATANAEIVALRNPLSKLSLFPAQKSYNRATKKRIAILLTGLQKNMLVKTKLENVIEPVRAQGWDVDVFMEIVGLGSESGTPYKPVQDSTTGDSAQRTANELLTLFRQNLEMRGARLVHGVVLETDYNVTGDLQSAKDLARIHQYNPFNSVTGQNVLRRFKGLQTLMNVATATNDYDFVLVTRDTDLWLHELDLGLFSDAKDLTVFTKACREYFGVNDKTFLFTGAAAKAILLHVYDDFFNDRYSVLDYTFNAEEFWRKLITEVHDVHSLPTNPLHIPTTDAVWRFKNGSKELCVKKEYLCQALGSESETPIC